MKINNIQQKQGGRGMTKMSEEKSRQKIERLISENFRFGCLTQAKQAQTADRATQRVRWELSQKKIEADLSQTEQPSP